MIGNRHVGLLETPTDSAGNNLRRSLTWRPLNRRFNSSHGGLAEDTGEYAWISERIRGRRRPADVFQCRKDAYANRVNNTSKHKRLNSNNLREVCRGHGEHDGLYAGYAIPPLDDEDVDCAIVLRESNPGLESRKWDVIETDLRIWITGAHVSRDALGTHMLPNDGPPPADFVATAFLRTQI